MPIKKRILRQSFAVVGVLAFLALLLLCSGLGTAPHTPVTPLGYEDRIFKPDRIHSIHIQTDDWQDFLQACQEEAFLRCTVVINGEAFPNVGICAVDAASLEDADSERYSLRLEFGRYDSTQSYYGLDQLILNNLLYDNTMMKELVTYRLMAELGAATPLCSYATVYVNGGALGLYLAVEAIGDSFLTRNFGEEPGQLYQPEGNGTADVKLQYLGDDPDLYPGLFAHAQGTEADRLRLIRALKQLSSGKDLKSTVDIEAVTRYFAVHTFVCNADSYTGPNAGNYVLYEKDGKLSMLPGDYGLAFGATVDGDASAVINASIEAPVFGGTHKDRPMLAWFLESKQYTWLYHRFHIELLNIDIEPMIERTENMIAPYVRRDPTRLCTYEEFEAGVHTLKQFLELRAQSVQQQVLGKPATVDPGDLKLSHMGAPTAKPPDK